MLYSVLLALVFVAFVTFGAVLPNSSFLILMVMIAVSGAGLIISAIRLDSCRFSLLVPYIVVIVVAAFLPPRLAVGLCAGVLAWAAMGNTPKSTLRFFQGLVVLGLLEALLGLTQNFISPGWIFGYVNDAYRVSGTLINHNHYAGVLEMLIPVAFGLAFIAFRRFGDIARPYMYLLAAAFMGLALLFSVSRMGILSFLLTLLFLGIVLRLRKSQKRLALGFTVTVGGLVVLGALWVGIDGVIQRYSLLFGEDAILREGRILVFRDAMKLIAAHPTGIGFANFQDRFREYQTFRPDLLFDHAHNDYLETTAEWGVLPSVTFWVLVVISLVRAVRLFVSLRSPEKRGILLACIGAIFSILVHSLADFNLQIPSNAMLFFTFVGISLAITSDNDVSPVRLLPKIG